MSTATHTRSEQPNHHSVSDLLDYISPNDDVERERWNSKEEKLYYKGEGEILSKYKPRRF